MSEFSQEENPEHVQGGHFTDVGVRELQMTKCMTLVLSDQMFTSLSEPGTHPFAINGV